MAAPPGRRWLRRLGLALIAVGVLVCLVPVGYIVYGSWQQNQINQQWERQLHQPKAALPSTQPSSSPRSTQPNTGLLFALSVPEIDYYAAVQQGVDSNVLYAGPGHYPQTVLPGQAGTVGVAAHNTYWIKFGSLKAGDQIELQTTTQTYHYTITGTQVVDPSDVGVLQSKPGQHLLALTTCYPLWAGSLAQQRLVFFATQNGT